LEVEKRQKSLQKLITRDLFEERFKVVDERFKRLELKLNIIIILVLLALTLFNPAFLSIIEKLLKL
jgi:hypothetical protein